MNDSGHPLGLVLQAYFDDELPEADAAVVHEHCCRCVECENVLEDLKTVQDRMTTCQLEVELGPVWPQVAQRLHGETSRRFGPALALGTVAACAAGIVLGLLMGEPISNGSTEKDSLTWTSTSALLSSTETSSLINVYSGVYAKERSEGS